MRECGTGLSRGQGKCAGNTRGVSEIRADLVFRGTHHQCAHNANEISAVQAELVFRDVPGELVQRRRHAQRFGSFGLRRPLVHPPRHRIAGVPVTPVGLGFLPARGLTVGFAAGPLPVSHSRVRPEPPATDGARSLPGLGHRDDLSSSSHLQPHFGTSGGRSERLGIFRRAEVGNFSRAPKRYAALIRIGPTTALRSAKINWFLVMAGLSNAKALA